MAKVQLVQGTTSYICGVYIQDSTLATGGGKTGLTNLSSGLTCYYKTNNITASVSAAIATISTLGTYAGGNTSAAFKEVDATGMPGVYEFHVPNNAISATATESIVMLQGAANMVPIIMEFELTKVNMQDNVRFGLTSLPNAAAEASGGLYTRGTGAGQINQSDNGQIDTKIVAGSVASVNDVINAVHISGNPVVSDVINAVHISGAVAQVTDIINAVHISGNPVVSDVINAVHVSGAVAQVTDVINAVHVSGAVAQVTDIINAVHVSGAIAQVTDVINAVAVSGTVSVADKTGFSLLADQTGVTIGDVLHSVSVSGNPVVSDVINAVHVSGTVSVADKTGFSLLADQTGVTIGDILHSVSVSGNPVVSDVINAVHVSGAIAQVTDIINAVHVSGTVSLADDQTSVTIGNVLNSVSVSGTPAVNTTQIGGAASSATLLSGSAGTMASCAVIDTPFSPTTTQFETSSITDAAADFWKYRTVIFTSGTLDKQARAITASSLQSGKTRLTCDAFTSAPSNADTFIIV